MHAQEATRNSCPVAAMSSVFEALASFSSQARGIIFYNRLLSEIKDGLKFRCELEPFNARDKNSIVLKCSPTTTLGHLAREALAH